MKRSKCRNCLAVKYFTVYLIIFINFWFWKHRNEFHENGLTCKCLVFQKSCNSCADLGAMFQVMFSDRKIASQFKLGKTKARYAMLDWIALELKKQLIYDINATPFYTVSFDESLNSQVQVSQMDVGVLYWNSRKSIAETHYFDSNFM